MRKTSQDLHVEDAGDPDGTANALQTQWGHLWVVTVLQSYTERCQQGGPRQLTIRTIVLNSALGLLNPTS